MAVAEVTLEKAGMPSLAMVASLSGASGIEGAPSYLAVGSGEGCGMMTEIWGLSCA